MRMRTRYTRRDGETFVNAPCGHPRAAKGYVREHILVAELAVGHSLPPNAVVHHVNDNRSNNANRNLAILQNQSEHCQLHVRLRVIRAGGDPWRDRICSACQLCKPIENFYLVHGTPRNCKDCCKKRWHDHVNKKRGKTAA